MIERTLAILKPDAVAAGNSGAILARLEDEGFVVRGLKRLQLTEGQARAFYEVHRERPFFEGLVRFMIEGPVVVAALEREDAVAHMRKTMGATDSRKAEAGTIRSVHGTDIERNAIHGSDSRENAAREVAFFFSVAELVGSGLHESR
jgi:nucleoside-diphosphate kinase